MAKYLASALCNEGVGSARSRNARHSPSGEVEEFPMSGNVGLLESLKFARLSKSKGYQYGLIPVYDRDRNRIDHGKVAPFPWLPMPDSIIREPGQKKIFLAEEIRLWRDAITSRSRRIDVIALNNPSALIKRGEN